MSDDSFQRELRNLVEPVMALAASLREFEARAADELAEVAPSQRESARNLVHYLALRRRDIRDLQDRLAAVGLSSLGRAEACVGGTLAAVLAHLLRGDARRPLGDGGVTLATGRRLLERNTTALLGPPRADRHVRIAVTLPSEIAGDVAQSRQLLRGGMDLARINCAHDEEATWRAMIETLRAAASLEQRPPPRILMDLAGPKLRTGALAPGPEVLKVRPRRDLRGNVVEPARVWLAAGSAPPPPGATAIPVDGAWLARLRSGDVVQLVDARMARRRLMVRAVGDGGALVEAMRTIYFESGTTLDHLGGETRVGCLPPLEQPLLLRVGDRLRVTRDPAPGGAAPARIACTLPEVLSDVRAGERIWFDDGHIGGRVAAVDGDGIDVEITFAREGGSKLGADKGINLPDTRMRLAPLSARDEADLTFVAQHADLVGYSFVRHAADVIALHQRLSALGKPELGIVLKIETPEAFEQLPLLLLAAMRRPTVGVMIARGDLAVECGWERLAELQEEILWICEAAHQPVIWATQVLEGLAKAGQPSRAEITDAAMAERAECVMLNKGPHLATATEVLADILQRMQRHQSKKRSLLRPLAVAERFARHASRGARA